MFPPPWWIGLDVLAVLLLAIGLLGLFEPGNPLVAWLPKGGGLALTVMGGMLMAVALLLLVRLLAERAKNR
jgi:hypothetical protein